MTGFTDYWATSVLNHTTSKTPIPSLSSVWVAVYTAVGDDAGSFVEPSGNSYSRVETTSVAWNFASGSAPSFTSNAASIAFPPAAGPWGQLVGFGLHDALSGGNRLAWDYLGPYAWQVAFVQAGSPAPLQARSHGLAIGNSIVFSTEYAGVI